MCCYSNKEKPQNAVLSTFCPRQTSDFLHRDANYVGPGPQRKEPPEGDLTVSHVSCSLSVAIFSLVNLERRIDPRRLCLFTPFSHYC